MPQSLAEFERAFASAGDDCAAQIRVLLAGAVRAPSTHNCQPWRFRIDGHTLEVFLDDRIRLPYSDKDAHYAHISIGFLLHHLKVLGDFLGMHPEIVVTAGRVPLAVITFSSPSKEEADAFLRECAQAIFQRRNRRGVFSPTPIPADLLARLQTSPSELPTGLLSQPRSMITKRSTAQRIGVLTLATMEQVYKQPAFRREMAQWIVPTGSSRRDGIPGYSLNQSRVVSWILPHILRRFNIGKVPGKNSAAALASAPVIFAFGADNSRVQWLSVGYEASRIIISVTAQGFDASVYVATAELPDIREEVTELCNLSKPLCFLFAVGKLDGAVTWYTPRVPIEDKIIV